MVPDLSSVVEHTGFAGITGHGGDHIFQALAVELSAFNRLVQVGDVGVVVLAVVELQGGAGDVRLQRIQGVRQLGEGMGHEEGVQRRDPNESSAALAAQHEISPSLRAVRPRKSKWRWEESRRRHHGRRSPGQGESPACACRPPSCLERLHPSP